MKRKLFFLFLEKKNVSEIKKIEEWLNITLKKKKKIIRKSLGKKLRSCYSVKCIVDSDIARLRYAAIEDLCSKPKEYSVYIVNEFCYEEDVSKKNILLDIYSYMHGKPRIQELYIEVLTRLLKNFYVIHRGIDDEYKQVITYTFAKSIINYTVSKDELVGEYLLHYCYENKLTGEQWYKDVIEAIYDILRRGFKMPVVEPLKTDQKIVIHRN